MSFTFYSFGDGYQTSLTVRTNKRIQMPAMNYLPGNGLIRHFVADEP